MANRAGLYPDDRMERLRNRRGSADYQAATGVMRDVLVKVVNETYEDQLRSIDMPVHLLWGADDGEVPVAVAHTAARLLADSDLRVLPGVGHFVPSEAPEELRATVEGTLQ
jgi:pimeloyl-ACP methyl ester carboxylesterase